MRLVRKRISVFFEKNQEEICLLLIMMPVLISIVLTFIIPEKILYFVWVLLICFIGLGIGWHIDRKHRKEFIQKRKETESYLREKEEERKRDEIRMWAAFFRQMCKDGDDDA